MSGQNNHSLCPIHTSFDSVAVEASYPRSISAISTSPLIAALWRGRPPSCVERSS